MGNIWPKLIKTSNNHLEVINGCWLESKSLKYENHKQERFNCHRSSTVIIECNLDGGQRVNEIQIAWEPGVEVDSILLKGAVQLV